jgi:hypothetical protein
MRILLRTARCKKRECMSSCDKRKGLVRTTSAVALKCAAASESVKLHFQTLISPFHHPDGTSKFLRNAAILEKHYRYYPQWEL